MPPDATRRADSTPMRQSDVSPWGMLSYGGGGDHVIDIPSKDNTLRLMETRAMARP